ncbi:3'-5' exonuclease [Spirosoma endbachense]|uniref:3'-5' exonuclease n=1 Tax=Spirosoma endbachense TaxID=2666025 RepID=A0A6P1W373_9BACT|nr:exonuclease domain-containing protein [Spirosoma endbachense]QHV98998.1 3'-5' exonuclease [Spirosoma endbachense]
MYCIVDVETTGGVKGPTRLTEIAIFRHDGLQVVDSFHSLVNPECPIPPFIRHLTGISDEMVQEAPLFADIAEQVLRITHDAVFVAHNVGFDFNFIKKELEWLGYDYFRRTLCTVRTSRKVFPGFPSYSLGKLCNSLSIPLNNRHRAQGDAAATVRLFEMLLQHDAHGLIPRNGGASIAVHD